MTAWLRRAGLWIAAALGSLLALVVLLWRSAARERDKARDQRDKAQASARRGETVRVTEETAHVEAQAARAEVEVRVRESEARHETERREVERAGDDVDELAKIDNERRARR